LANEKGGNKGPKKTDCDKSKEAAQKLTRGPTIKGGENGPFSKTCNQSGVPPKKVPWALNRFTEWPHEKTTLN